jgi:hypothetical protein
MQCLVSLSFCLLALRTCISDRACCSVICGLGFVQALDPDLEGKLLLRLHSCNQSAGCADSLEGGCFQEALRNSQPSALLHWPVKALGWK